MKSGSSILYGPIFLLYSYFNFYIESVYWKEEARSKVNEFLYQIHLFQWWIIFWAYLNLHNEFN